MTYLCLLHVNYGINMCMIIFTVILRYHIVNYTSIYIIVSHENV